MFYSKENGDRRIHDRSMLPTGNFRATERARLCVYRSRHISSVSTFNGVIPNALLSHSSVSSELKATQIWWVEMIASGTKKNCKIHFLSVVICQSIQKNGVWAAKWALFSLPQTNKTALNHRFTAMRHLLHYDYEIWYTMTFHRAREKKKNSLILQCCHNLNEFAHQQNNLIKPNTWQLTHTHSTQHT